MIYTIKKRIKKLLGKIKTLKSWKKIEVRLYKTCQKRMPDQGVFTDKLNRSHLTFYNYDHRTKDIILPK